MISTACDIKFPIIFSKQISNAISGYKLNFGYLLVDHLRLFLIICGGISQYNTHSANNNKHIRGGIS